MTHRHTLTAALAGLTLSLTGCSLGYPDMAGEWYGTCDSGGVPFPFELFALNEYQGAGYINGATGEHVVYPHRGRMLIDGVWETVAAESIYCTDDAGCTFGANELEDVPVDFTRIELTYYYEDKSTMRMIADAVREDKKSLEGTCWNSSTGQWGTFSAERVQNPWYDGHETEQTHPGSE